MGTSRYINLYNSDSLFRSVRASLLQFLYQKNQRCFGTPIEKKKIIALLWLDTESWVADTSRNFSELFQDIEIKFSPLLSLAASNFSKFLTQKMAEQTINNATEKTTVMDEALTNSLPSK